MLELTETRRFSLHLAKAASPTNLESKKCVDSQED